VVDQLLLNVMQTLCWDTRQQILVAVARGEASARDIASEVRMPISTVRENLAKLAAVDLVEVVAGTAGRRTFQLGSRVRIKSRDRDIVIDVITPRGSRISLTRPEVQLCRADR